MADQGDDEIPTGEGVYTSLEELAADFPPGTQVYEMAKSVFAGGKKWVRIEPMMRGRGSEPGDLN
jgi:hypothetical protein